jgi:phage-related minor tail protein
VTAFARGGIVDRPVLFPMANGTGLMGEAGPEAVMPLGRDSRGRLGVRAANQNAGTVVNVYDMRRNGASEPVRTEERQRPDGRREIAVLIEEKMDDAISSGRMDRSMGSAFGSRRQTKRV